MKSSDEIARDIERARLQQNLTHLSHIVSVRSYPAYLPTESLRHAADLTSQAIMALRGTDK
jgi:hypothetical protein